VKASSGRKYSKYGATVIDEAFEFDHLRHQIEVDSNTVWPYHRFNLQRDAGISSFERLRRSRCHDANLNRSSSTGSPTDTRNMRRGERYRITKFSDDFDDSTLAAFRRHSWGRKKIDPFFLIERADDDLKLRIGEHTS